MAALAILSLGLSIIAILISLRSVRYTKRQTELMEGSESRRQREEQDLELWARKFEEAVACALKIGPPWIQTTRGQTNAYGVVCPNPELRQRFETYLVNQRNGNFSRRQ